MCTGWKTRGEEQVSEHLRLFILQQKSIILAIAEKPGQALLTVLLCVESLALYCLQILLVLFAMLLSGLSATQFKRCHWGIVHTLTLS
jgi:hypothetical protein